MPEAIIEHRDRDSILCIRTTSGIENEVYRMPFTRRTVYDRPPLTAGLLVTLVCMT
jgi:hypothetical protein